MTIEQLREQLEHELETARAWLVGIGGSGPLARSERDYAHGRIDGLETAYNAVCEYEYRMTRP